MSDSQPSYLCISQNCSGGSEAAADSKELADKIQRLRDLLSAQILYLPTFRRIERELSSILEGIDPDELRRNRVNFATERRMMRLSN